MLQVNEGGLDRTIRILFGATLAWLGYASGIITGALATVTLVVGVVLIITGVTGFCGLYTVLGINTCPMKK
jgi:hypothetical protein